MATREERIKALRDKAERFKEKAEKLEKIESEKSRKWNERKKYILGASILAAIKAGLVKEEDMVALVDQFNERASDRALFELPPR